MPHEPGNVSLNPNERFGKLYFEEIWGDVHRHDYCESLADQLIAKYGRVRYLDIGTGCGYLVKVLRDKGCDAYGVDVSEYAVENSHGNVLVADVRKLPFADHSFDVVYSQGLWEYIPESDISQAFKEVTRLGTYQEHNIDTTNDTAEWTSDFETHKPRNWWDNKLIYPKMLIACPNHVVKEYAFQRWIDNVKAFTYPNLDILVVDNSPNGELLAKYGDQVPMAKIDTKGLEDLTTMRINLSYEVIRRAFLGGDYERLFSIDSDTIPPVDMAEWMLKLGGDTDWISHSYPARGDTVDAQQGLGCSIFTRRLMKTFDFASLGDSFTADGGLWDRVRPDGRYTTMELWNYRKVQHLSN